MPAFVSELASEAPLDTAPETYLRGLDLEGLFLARACARGDGRAIAAFEADYFPDLVPVLSEAGLGSDMIDEVRQILRENFFVGKRGRPLISSYSGRGSLRGWVRISAVREALHLTKERSRWEPLGEADMMQLPALGDNPELKYLKKRCRREFKAAFAAAAAALAPRQRNLLRYYYLEGMSIDQIAGLYRIPRSSAGRWLAEARQALLSRTRRCLAERMDVRGQDYESLLRLIESQAEISMRVLVELTGSSES